MLLRRIIPPAAAMLALACAPSIQQDPQPTSVTYAVFDPTASKIPLPNDLALLPDSIAAFPPSAQKDLLSAWAVANGFPNDQEVSLTIDFQTVNIDPATGASSTSAPDLDITSLATGVKVIKLPGTLQPIETPVAADYVKVGDHGTLTIHNKGHLPWPSGSAGNIFAVGVLGGTGGVKTAAGGTVNASAVFFLLTRGLNLTDPANQGLIPGDKATRAATGAKLEPLRSGYITPFAAMASVAPAFPTTDLAVMGTFHIEPQVAHVELDPGRGVVPLPIDLLRDPRPFGSCAGCGMITLQAGCSFASGTYNAANNTCSTPAARGFTAMDGFSTTGPLLLPIDNGANLAAASITPATVMIYDLTNPVAPALVNPSTYITQPCEVTGTVSGASGCGATGPTFTPAIVLMPATATAGDPSSVYRTKPLKENTDYAVVVTTGVKDATGQAMGPGTVARILLFDNPLVNSSGSSLLQGIDNNTAGALEVMRQRLIPVRGALATKSITKDKIAMAYTFHTQSITGADYARDKLAGNAPSHPPGLLEFAAIPYSDPALSTQFAIAPTFTVYTPAQAWTKWGLDAATPNADIAEIIHATSTTFDLLSDVSGGFDPTKLAPANAPAALRRVKVLLAIPKASAVTATCPSQYGVGAAKCAPLVVFHHGLGASKASMLAVANEYTKAGFVVAAIDGSKHGDRAWCSADAECNGGAAGSCVKIPNSENQGDTKPPGICSTGNVKGFTNCSTTACLGAWASYTDGDGGPDGYALNSANYFVTKNFFRSRDTLRQDVIDQSALILALARPAPSAALPAVPAANLALTGFLLTPNAATGGQVLIDPAKIYYVGQSLGSILGTLNLASNPRISRGVLNVGGGSVVDVFTNSPNLSGATTALLASLGIVKGTGAYLQFLVVAKMILDGADPINFAGNLLGAANTLPDLLVSPGLHMAPKSVLGQMATCDLTVPNAFNLELYSNIGLPPFVGAGTTNVANAAITLFANVGAPKTDVPSMSNVCPAAAAGISIPITGSPTGAVPHSFITSLGVAITGLTAAGVPNAFFQDPTVFKLAMVAQDEGAAFLADPVNNLPPPVVPLHTP